MCLSVSSLVFAVYGFGGIPAASVVALGCGFDLHFPMFTGTGRLLVGLSAIYKPLEKYLLKSFAHRLMN